MVGLNCAGDLHGCRVLADYRGSVDTDNGRGFLDQPIIGQCVNHKERENCATCEIAGKNRITDMMGPNWQALALALFEI